MYSNNGQIRNSKGSFICEAFYDEDAWVVAIKKKTVYTYIKLYNNGSIRITNENASKLLKTT